MLFHYLASFLFAKPVIKIVNLSKNMCIKYIYKKVHYDRQARYKKNIKIPYDDCILISSCLPGSKIQLIFQVLSLSQVYTPEAR